MKLYFFTLVFFIQSSVIYSNDTVIISKIYKLSKEKKMNYDTILKLYNRQVKKFEIDGKFAENLNLTSYEIKELSFCFIENMLNSKKYKNAIWENTDKNDVAKVMNDCLSFYIERMNERSGSVTKPNFQIKKNETFKQYDKLININGWPKESIYDIYGNCINNIGRLNDFIKAGYSKENYFEYCDCLINNIVKTIDIVEIKEIQSYRKKIELIATECVSKLD